MINEEFNDIQKKYQKAFIEYFKEGYLDSLAKILIYVDDEAKLEVLEQLPENIRSQVIEKNKALINEGKIRQSPDVISEAGRALLFSKIDTEQLALDYLSKFDATQITSEHIEEIDKENPLFAMLVDENVFRFEDFLILDDRSIQKVLCEIDISELAKALKSSSETLKEKFFRNMSRRAGNVLREEIEFMGAIRLSDSLEAQNKILGIVKNLINSGEIISPRTSDIFVC